MSKEELLDDEQIRASRTNSKLEEIKLLREAEQHYEQRLWTGRIGMAFIGYLFLSDARTFIVGHTFFMINLGLGLFYFLGAYLVKYRPRAILFTALGLYFVLMTLAFLYYDTPPHGAIVTFLFILFVGQSLTVAQKLIIIRQRLSDNGEIPRYKQVWY